jgi:hypothetical protein
VSDTHSKESLAHVNIYLSGTTIGAPSELDGSYQISKIPPGIYDLVFDHIGYNLKVISVQIIPNKVIEINSKLQKKVFSGEEVIVYESTPKAWKANLEKFQKIFIGSTKNAEKCKIINPEVLNFEYQSEYDLLSARSDSLIIVENLALGYRIKVRLLSFLKKSNNWQYLYYPYFSDISRLDSMKAESWEQARKKSYLGSYSHFINSLVQDKLEQNKFVILSGPLKLLKGNFGKVQSFSDLMEPDYSEPLYLRLKFEGYLKVIYEEDFGESYLKLMGDHALLDTLGNILDPFSIRKYGKWANMGVADLLPLDYNLNH